MQRTRRNYCGSVRISGSIHAKEAISFRGPKSDRPHCIDVKVEEGMREPEILTIFNDKANPDLSLETPLLCSENRIPTFIPNKYYNELLKLANNLGLVYQAGHNRHAVPSMRLDKNTGLILPATPKTQEFILN